MNKGIWGTVFFVFIFLLTNIVSANTIQINQFGTDINNQYSYNYDYSSSVVTLTYNEVNDKFTGTISATGLKPYATYQLKFAGKPTCAYENGNDLANEYIGLNGRWTCLDCIGTALQRNRNDAQYYARSHFRGDNSECIQGYLVFDFFTADENGNAQKTIEASNSYHVLWCGGGTCGSVNNNYLYKPDNEHVDTFFCPKDKVNGQIERGLCGGLSFSPGNYDIIISLTEESFHKGNWSTVLSQNISFTITQTAISTTSSTTTVHTTVPTTISTTTTSGWTPTTWNTPTWNPPSWNPPVFNLPTRTIPTWNHPTWNTPTWNPPSWNPPVFNLPTRTIPTWNPPDFNWP